MSKEHDAWEPIQGARTVLNKAMVDLANLTKSLHTDRIAQIGLAESIHFELENINRTGLVEVEYNVQGIEQSLDDQKSIVLFRVFQENLNNILKHSKAKHVQVTLTYLEDKFIMKVADDGVGFNVEEKKNSTSSAAGVGLKSIFNRAKLIGAEISMHSEPGHGTIVTIQLPLPESKSE
jgi:signal transduction histidine kinase